MTGTMIITGTRRGIGRAMAEHFLAAGWRVAGCSRGESDLSHPNYRHHQADVGDEVAVRAMVREVGAEWGGLDALVNNAGIASMNALLLTPQATVERVFRTNAGGTFNLMREAGKVMTRARSGRIVNFSSIARPLNLEGEAAYAASKAAVESLTRVAARELGPYGITVNAIGPSAIDTGLTATVPAGKLEELRKRQAVPGEGTFADVIHVVEFFLHPASRFVSGQVIYLGGVPG